MKNKLQDKFEDFGSIPSADVWDRIERELDQKKKKRRLIIWFSSGFAAILFLFLYINFNPTPLRVAKNKTHKTLSGTNTPALSTTQKISPVDSNELTSDESYIPGTNKNTSQKNKSFKIRENSFPKNEEKFHIEQEKFETEIVKRSVELDLKTEQLVFTEKDSVGNENPKDSISIASKENKDSTILVEKKNESKDSSVLNKKWSLEIKLASWDAVKNRNQPTIADNTTSYDFLNTGVFPATSFNNYKSASLTKPISLGLHVNYLTGKNWVFSSGLNFDYMKATLESTNSLSTSHFVSFGVPLGIGYQFRAEKKLVIIPKFSLRNDFILYNLTRDENSTMESVTTLKMQKMGLIAYQNAFQFDLNFSYKISEKSRLQLSPVMKYHMMQNFKTGSEKILERKFWYGIQAGYCFDI